MNYKDMPLVASPLSDVDRALLVRLVGHLADFLRAPGDWGYRTKLGELTERLIDEEADMLKDHPTRRTP